MFDGIQSLMELSIMLEERENKRIKSLAVWRMACCALPRTIWFAVTYERCLCGGVFINNTCRCQEGSNTSSNGALSEVDQCALPLRRSGQVCSDAQLEESGNAEDYCRISMCPFALEFNTGVAMLCMTPEFFQSNGLSYTATQCRYMWRHAVTYS